MSSKEDGVWPSSFKKERSMPIREEVVMARLLEKRGVWPSSFKRERSMTMAIFFPSLVRSCGGGHGISSKEEEV